MSLGALIFDRRAHPGDASEVYALPPGQVEALLPVLRERLGPVVVLSTCARLELYAPRPAAEVVAPFLAVMRDRTGRRLDPALFGVLDEEEAARHLFRVAAGLNSSIVGESEVLGQVRGALTLAATTGDVGTVLHRLFHAAVRSGRRVRAETGLARGSVSLASTALSMAAAELGTLEGRHVLVIGAGQIGAAVARHAHAIGARVMLANRSLARALELAKALAVTAHPLSALPELLPLTDCVISATGAPHEILAAADLERALALGHGRYVIVDVALPRDVDPAAAGLPGVVVHDLDAVQRQANEAARLREAEVQAAERILDEELARFNGWYRGVNVTPTIAALQRRADEVRRRAVAMTLAKLPHLADGDRERIEVMANAIVAQLLSTPISRLKTAEDPETYARILGELFALDGAADGVTAR